MARTKSTRPTTTGTDETTNPEPMAPEAAKVEPAPDYKAMAEEMAQRTMSVTAAAKELGLSLSAVNHHVKAGHIAGFKVGTASVLLSGSVRAFKANRAEEAPEAARLKELRAEMKALRAKLKK